MRRRTFISLLGGAAAAWPVVARGQPADRMPRLGVLVAGAVENTSEILAGMAAFRQALAQLGWTEGRNLRIDSLVAVGSPDKVSEYAAELATLAPALVALAPDVILTNGTMTVDAMLRATSTVPIVFVNATDPSGAGFVNGSLRPGGNATGFTNFPQAIANKWLELLKEIAPSVTRVGILRDPGTTAGDEQWAAIQAVARSLGVEVIPADLGREPEIMRAFAAFARSSNKNAKSGLIITTSMFAIIHRKLIIELAAQHKFPAIYFRRLFVAEGGPISYGADLIQQYRLAASYVDRILKGERPSDLPVQAPTKHELVINLKTAKVLGLTVPDTLLVRVDEVIE